MSVPTWLRNLIDVDTPQPLKYKRHARLTVCDRCMMRALSVHESYPWGRNVLIDPEPLNAIGEAWALQCSFNTYRMRGNLASALEFDLRMSYDIIVMPCGEVLPSGNVVRVAMQHVCGLIIPMQYREDAYSEW